MDTSITITDTHAAVKNLEAKGASKELAEEIVATVQAAKVASDPTTRSDLKELETRIYKALLIQTGAIAAIVLGVLQLQV